MSLFTRAASLAAVPVKTGARFATAATAAAFGADRVEAYGNAMQASVETLTTSLAKARGPALKFGQILALFSSTLPPEQAAMLASLGRLYENAQPRPWSKVEGLVSSLPPGTHIEPVAIAAASLGQVHAGTWPDGTPIAVKIQYPDAHRIVRADLLQLRTFIPLIHRLLPTLDVKALLDEHADRLWEELDYTREARWQEAFREAWDRAQPGIVTIPRVLLAEPTLLVTEWLPGVPYSALVDSPAEQRDAAGRGLARFTLWSAHLVGAVHADPHPGNYRLLDDGSLGVLDFGSVGHPAGAFTDLFVRTFDFAAVQDYEGLRRMWLDAGMLVDSTTADELVALLAIDLTPYENEEFQFTPEWMTGRADGWSDPAASLQNVGKLSFPPGLLLEHRAVTGMLALLTSISATVDFRTVLDNALDPAGGSSPA
jgi:predicted unusual protein kinase regulating ubiquinone biosynthesis (AarF/ABC1/UbiB family)